MRNHLITWQKYNILIGQFEFEVQYIENNTWARGNTRFISSVEHDINTRNRSGISKHPCMFLFII